MQSSQLSSLRRTPRPILSLLALTTLGCAWTTPEPSSPRARAHDAELVFPRSEDDSIELADLFDFLDRDRDGRIGAYEGAEAFLLLTGEADGGGDGAVDPSELVGYLARSKAEERDALEETLREFDRDGDGSLTSDEFPEEFSGVVPAFDLDGDGSLSLQEFLAADALDDPRFFLEQELRGVFAELDGDGDGDGALTLDDLSPSERGELQAQFGALDADGDGRVDETEFLGMLDEELQGASFEVTGTDAEMTGTIGPTTPGRVLELIPEHPGVERIVMRDVPGSLDDDSNLRAARWVRRHGFATHVPDGGEVASGGTDFFQAGVVRTRGEGARFGIHSWSGFGEEGADVSRDDPEHAKYVDYCREMGIPKPFYWYTLDAAPADDIHWMTDEELERFDMLTDDPLPREDPSDLIGGCVLAEPVGEVTEQLDRLTAVRVTDEFQPFSKCLSSCGIVLVAETGVPDVFLERVGRTIAEIFRMEEGIDLDSQGRVLTALYARRALLPVPRTEASFDRLLEQNEPAIDRLRHANSLCDIIMADVPEGEVMEVVEHILHTVTDVGLPDPFPSEWGLSRESKLWEAMQRAIERGDFVIDSYGDLRGEDPAVYDRILMQEFAYWFLSTAWDLQVPYGPDESEWSIRTPAELRRADPEFFAIFERTADRVMRAPSRETLATIGPPREVDRR